MGGFVLPQTLLPSEWLALATVRIECSVPEGTSTGTGFFFSFLRSGDRHVPAIVTNKHVVAGATAIRFFLTDAESENQPSRTSKTEISLPGRDPFCIDHPRDAIDLVAIPIAPIQRMVENQGKKLFYVTLSADDIPTAADIETFQAMEDIVMVGYPNGIWDSVNNQPIIRRGVTATHPALDYEGKPEFLIDAACFPGSSGSPVLLYNTMGYLDRQGNMQMGTTRIKLLGVLYAGPQYTARGEIVLMSLPPERRPVAVSDIPINLGAVIKASTILELEEPLRSKFGAPPA